MVAGLVIRDRYLNYYGVFLKHCIDIQPDCVLQQCWVGGARHKMAENGHGIALHPPHAVAGEMINFSGRHVAILAGLAGFCIAVGRRQPFAK